MLHGLTYPRRLILTLAIALIASSASAQLFDGPIADRPTLFRWFGDGEEKGGADLNEPLVTDRPDFTESSVTVGYGVVQLETGYTYTYDDEHHVRVSNHSFPESLLRIGMLTDWTELRLEWNYEGQRTNTGGVIDRDWGSDDLVVGMKAALTPQDVWLPETAIILEMSVPSGAESFTAGEVLPGFNFCYGWDLTEDKSWDLGCSTALGGDTDDITGDNHAQFSQSASLGHKWTERIHSYVEWYLFAPINADTDKPQYYFNRGCTFLFTDNLQWDIRAGLGLNRYADDFFAGTGLSIRYW